MLVFGVVFIILLLLFNMSEVWLFAVAGVCISKTSVLAAIVGGIDCEEMSGAGGSLVAVVLAAVMGEAEDEVVGVSLESESFLPSVLLTFLFRFFAVPLYW